MERLILNPYSNDGLAKRDSKYHYFVTIENVMQAKNRLLDFLFGNPGCSLNRLNDDSMDILGDILPIENLVDLDDQFSRLIDGLKADGELVIKYFDGTYFPSLTEQSLGKIAEIRKRQIEDQISIHRKLDL